MIKQNEFESLPIEVTESNLTQSQKSLLDILFEYNGLEYSQSYGYFFISNEEILKRIKGSKTTLIKNLALFQNLGFINRKVGKRDKDGVKASTYKLNIDIILTYCKNNNKNITMDTTNANNGLNLELHELIKEMSNELTAIKTELKEVKSILKGTVISTKCTEGCTDKTSLNINNLQTNMGTVISTKCTDGCTDKTSLNINNLQTNMGTVISTKCTDGCTTETETDIETEKEKNKLNNKINNTVTYNTSTETKNKNIETVSPNSNFNLISDTTQQTQSKVEDIAQKAKSKQHYTKFNLSQFEEQVNGYIANNDIQMLKASVNCIEGVIPKLSEKQQRWATAIQTKLFDAINKNKRNGQIESDFVSDQFKVKIEQEAQEQKLIDTKNEISHQIDNLRNSVIHFEGCVKRGTKPLSYHLEAYPKILDYLNSDSVRNIMDDWMTKDIENLISRYNKVNINTNSENTPQTQINTSYSNDKDENKVSINPNGYETNIDAFRVFTVEEPSPIYGTGN